jgi:hypothetical protein
MATSWLFKNQKLQLRNPANTFTSTVVNPAVASNSNFQFNTPYDYYIFIDPDDSNTIKARNGRTGTIVSTHISNADVVFQYAIDQLSVGSTSSGEFWSGGKYGSIFVGPGIFNFYKYVILKSHIYIQFSGRWATKLRLADNIYNGGHNDNTIGIFKSSTWDVNSISTTTNAATAGDNGVILRDVEIDGNYTNNRIPDVNTATSKLVGGVETAGFDSWGHGIAFWGYDLICENVYVHNCPGAGIILQNNNAVGVMNLDGGAPYPLGTGTHTQTTLSCFNNIRCVGNGRQGLLLRGPAYVHNYWSYYNGEAGLDAQQSAYFFAGGWIDGIECFLDGAKHGSYVSADVYDPLGFEVRLASTQWWLTNAWIEGPYGRGDNLMLGANGTSGSTGYQIKGAGNIKANDLQLDSSRASHIFVGSGTTPHIIKAANIVGGNMASTVNNISNIVTPATILGQFNDIEIYFSGFVDDAPNNFTANGVVIGSVGAASNFNKITLYTANTKYLIDNQNSGSINSIDAVVGDQASASTIIMNPGGSALSIGNDINIRSLNNSSSLTKSHNGGTATLTWVTGQTVYIIPHKLFAAPNVYDVRPHNAAAVTAGSYFVTADATNVIINFTSAPANSSMTFIWNARVSP